MTSNVTSNVDSSIVPESAEGHHCVPVSDCRLINGVLWWKGTPLTLVKRGQTWEALPDGVIIKQLGKADEYVRLNHRRRTLRTHVLRAGRA